MKTITCEDAYRKGWEASKRTTTADLDAAEGRFENRYGTLHSHAFSNGWIDYSAEHEYGHSIGWCAKRHG